MSPEDAGWMSQNHKEAIAHQFKLVTGVDPSMANQATLNGYLDSMEGRNLEPEEKEFLRRLQDGDILPLNKYDTSFLLYVKWAVENNFPLQNLVKKYNSEPQIQLNGFDVNIQLIKLEIIAKRIQEGSIIICTDYDGPFVGVQKNGKLDDRSFFNAAAYDHRKGLNAATVVLFFGGVDPHYSPSYK